MPQTIILCPCFKPMSSLHLAMLTHATDQSNAKVKMHTGYRWMQCLGGVQSMTMQDVSLGSQYRLEKHQFKWLQFQPPPIKHSLVCVPVPPHWKIYGASFHCPSGLVNFPFTFTAKAMPPIMINRHTFMEYESFWFLYYRCSVLCLKKTP